MLRTQTKKITAFLSVVAMLLSMLLYFPGGTFSTYSGLKASAATITPTEPSKDSDGVYQIGTAAELYWFAGLVNGTLDGVEKNIYANAVLTANIVVNTGVLKSDGALADDTSGFISWTPMGKELGRYSGTFNGNGHTISGLFFNDTSIDYVGLFGYIGYVEDENNNIISTGKLSNVGVVDSYFKGNNCVGGVCGYINAGDKIENCYNTGNVSGNSNVGGVCGKNYVRITNCYNSGTVSGTGNYVGGVCGYNVLNLSSGTIENCYNTGTVSGKGDNVGGVCGNNDRGAITSCYNTGTVSGEGDNVGGMCGRNYCGSAVGTIINCYNTGAVSGKGDNVGGVCGDNYLNSIIENCYNTGTVSGKGSYIGGVCGRNKGSTIKNCYYDSNVYSGNAVGYNTGTVTSVEGKPTADFINCTVCELVGYHQRVLANASGAYEISKACQLHWFANYVNSGNTSANAVLTANITVNLNVLVNGELNANLKNPRKWTPIGNYSKPYTGTFNGQGHTISGLYFNDANTDYVGLFGYNNGTVKNIGIIDSYFNGTRYVAAVCGLNDCGTITNCYNTGAVTATGDYASAGGVCGKNSGTITSCYNTSTVIGTRNVGGVCGKNSVIITNCYNAGKVTATGTGSVGGVCGYSGYLLTNCYNTGEVSGSDNAGGVCGQNGSFNQYGTITNCYNAGKVSGTSIVGNVCGYNVSGEIQNCYYLAETATGGDGKTEAQFNSGEVAYLLNGSTIEGTLAWGQKIGTDPYPVLDGTKTVYRNENYSGCEMNPGTLYYTYSNTEKELAYGEHSYDANGFCQHSSEAFYQPATETTDKYDMNGDNVKDKVYEISNAGQLYWLADQVKNDHTNFKNANAVLTADITVNTGVLQSDGSLADDTSSFRSWTPIGFNDLRIYTGIFDGQGHTVSGLYVDDASTNFVGLFGCAGTSSSVSNVGVVDSYFNGNNNVGGVCGYSNGKITNCYNQGTVNGSGYVGGICGEAGPGSTSKITSCYNVGIVKGKSNTACVVGYADSGKVSNCYYYGEEAKVTTPVVTSPVFPIDPIIPFLTTTAGRKITIPSVFTTTTTTVTTTENINLSTTSEPSSTTQSSSEPTEATGDEQATPKTAEQFASGEVAYLLNGSTSEGTLAWGQKIGTDAYPVLDGTKQVYKIKKTYCDGSNVMDITGQPVYIYANSATYVLHNMTEHPANAATCTEAGNYAYWTCSREDGVYYKDKDGTETFANLAATVIPAHGHNMTEHPANAATCTATGNYAYWTCSHEDGVYYKDEAGTETFANLAATAIPAHGHNMTEHPANAATCTEPGNYAYWTCSYEDGVYYKDEAGTEEFASLSATVIPASGHDMTEHPANDATCTEPGNYAYWTCSREDGVYYKDEAGTETFANLAATVIPASGHDMTEHSANAATCTEPGNYAYWTCSREDGVYYKDAEGTETFASLAATVIPASGHEYTSGGICKSCSALENGKDGFKSASLTLTDGVILNYYLLLSQEALADSDAYIHFTSAQGLDVKTSLSEGIEDNGKYKFSLELRPDQMADVITAKVVYGDGSEGNCINYSVQEYAENVAEADDSKALVDAMLKFGAFTQLYTGKNTDNLAVPVSDYTTNASIDESYKYTLDGEVPGISVKGATLQIGAYTTIRLKFQLAEGADIQNYTFKCGETVLEPEKSGEFYFVYLRNIRPQDLDEMYSFTASDGTSTTTFTYSAFTYMKHALDNAEVYDQKLVNLVNAMYEYHQAADKYNMKTGWVQDGENWYYYNENGIKQTGWVTNIPGYDDAWFYFNDDGIMQTGWVTNIPGYDDAWFYFNDDGTLLTNSYTPDGFYVDENGIWIPGK